ncbi:MAG: lipid-A-disaccharide synthase, partial [Cyclobacteriaceae bacterium]
NLPSKIYEKARSAGLKLVFNGTYDLLFHARAAIVTSGTATLETALFKVPQVVVYRTSAVSYQIARHLIKVPFISLVNLVAEMEVVKELIQATYNKEAVMEELRRLLKDGENRNAILRGYERLIEKIGQKKASQETARLIYQSLIS